MPYGGNEHIENNITKAFINTLEVLTDNQQYSVIDDLFRLNISKIPDNDIRIYYYLQKKPSYKIECFPKENRLLFAISPTGKAWKTDYLSYINKTDGDKEKTLEHVTDDMKTMDRDEADINKDNELLNIEIAETKKILSGKGNSIPDAWILIYVKDEPYYAIIIENKLYDLNPFQLLNHKNKSLLLELTEYVDLNKDENIIFKKYEDIYECLYKSYYTNTIVKHFIEYLDKIGHGKPTPFSMSDFKTFMSINNKEDENQKEVVWKKLRREVNEAINELKSEYDFFNDVNTMQIWIKNIDSANVFIDISKETLKIDISTEVGVSKNRINRNLFPKLKKNLLLQNKLHSAYSGDIYYLRYIRLNHKSQSLYFWIHDYEDLNTYLNCFDIDEIYQNQVDKEECITMLDELVPPKDNPTAMRNLRHYKFAAYNKLEYLRIMNKINTKEHIGEKDDLKETIKNTVINHLKGIDILENIYYNR